MCLDPFQADLIRPRLISFPAPSLSSSMGPNPTFVVRLGAGKAIGARIGPSQPETGL